MSDTTMVAVATRLGKEDLDRIEAPAAAPIDQGGVPVGTRDFRAWINGDGSIETGIWECDAGTFQSRFEHHGEMIYILQGEMHCTSNEGASFTLAEGDSCTFPKGWSGTWDVKRPIRKLYTVWTNES